MALHYANFLQVVHTLQIKTVDGLKSFQIQSGLIGHQPAYQNGVGEREGERDREIGESETNIFRPKRTIHLGSKVTVSSSGNLLIHFRSISKSILDVGKLTYKRWRTDI